MHLALDLSKRSTGWAAWREGQDRPSFGHWVLGSEYTTTGQTFVKLHRSLNDLWQICHFETVTYEEPLQLGPGAGNTTAETQFLLIGLAAHVESFCASKNVRRCSYVNQSTWRRHWIGRMARPKKAKTTDLKDMGLVRCRELGWNATRHDESDALGILDYQLNNLGITTPWQDRAVFGAIRG